MADANSDIQKQKPKTSRKSILLDVVILAAILAGLGWLFWAPLFRPRRHPRRLRCAADLRGLGLTMMLYTNDFEDEYPAAEKWCDLLVEYEEADPRHFVCRGAGAKVGESSYAFNRNLVGWNVWDVPPDAVLLFETYVGMGAGERDGLLSERRSCEFCERCASE